MISMKYSSTILILGMLLGILAGTTENIDSSSPKNIDFAYHPSFFSILCNNIGVVLTLILGGIILFSIPTILVVLLNGIRTGLTIMICIRSSNLMPILAGILPHGVFELSGYVFAATIGLESTRLIIDVMLDGPSRNQGPSLKQGLNSYLTNDYMKYIILSIILITMGALIESTCSLYLMEMFA